MNEPGFDPAQAGKWFAIEANNRAWDLLEKQDRTTGEDTELLHAAHAACHHWRGVGTETHHARAECLVALANAELGLAESAVRQSQCCLELVQSYPDLMQDWDVAFAYDCAARAQAAAGQRSLALELKTQARDHGDRICDAEDRKLFDQWFGSGCWHGLDA